ncbi:hypothetical protein CONPUDRAFT_168802 [Coniophora puteana RWD-64-598 SS2]|uniref:Uncharacterized protein n=1 Tax=Coniophora puteana (strain RWD-64-598) TaxID=741705 RepID=A0A5M3MAW8_CONPW|nr:uncharacterized protein CONPUDRAFT_168802 [Coniophora puteana RWD-64-598 SS2]EIW76223.1 hypothetical protein CONPUDRAFT_168802 [Coniophora puteana RWD-64-598 SS2]
MGPNPCATGRGATVASLPAKGVWRVHHSRTQSHTLAAGASASAALDLPEPAPDMLARRSPAPWRCHPVCQRSRQQAVRACRLVSWPEPPRDPEILLPEPMQVYAPEKKETDRYRPVLVPCARWLYCPQSDRLRQSDIREIQSRRALLLRYSYTVTVRRRHSSLELTIVSSCPEATASCMQYSAPQ